MLGRIGIVSALVLLSLPAAALEAKRDRGALDALIARYAQEYEVPETLVHRIVMRESRYNPGAVGRGGAMGLMQIKHATARAQGFSGPASGLLDAETNLKFAVKYLAGAWRIAKGSHDRAVGYYARGYYYEAKRQGLTPSASRGRTAVAANEPTREPALEAQAEAPSEAAAYAERPAVTVDSVLIGMTSGN